MSDNNYRFFKLLFSIFNFYDAVKIITKTRFLNRLPALQVVLVNNRAKRKRLKSSHE